MFSNFFGVNFCLINLEIGVILLIVFFNFEIVLFLVFGIIWMINFFVVLIVLLGFINILRFIDEGVCLFVV